MTIDQQLVDRIVARAQNSACGLGAPEGSYELRNYSNPTLHSLAILLVSAHHSKYDLISLFSAAMEEVEEATKREQCDPVERAKEASKRVCKDLKALGDFYREFLPKDHPLKEPTNNPTKL